MKVEDNRRVSDFIEYNFILQIYFLGVQGCILKWIALCDPKEISPIHTQNNSFFLFFLPLKFLMSLLHFTGELLDTNGLTYSCLVRTSA